MRRVLIAALFCTFSACSCGTTPCVTVGGGTGGFGGAGGGAVPITQIAFVGTTVAVELDTTVALNGCSGSAVPVTGLEVEVLDPTDTNVAATASSPEQGAGTVSTVVTFTPATPGPYHVSVRFLPSSGTVQKDLLVAVDKSGATAHTEVLDSDVAGGCNDLDIDVGAADTVLCLTNQDTLYALQNGATTAMWPSDSFALSQGRVWSHSSSDNALHLLGLGSNGTLTDLASQPFSAVVDRVLAVGDDALVVGPDGFVEAHFSSDGGLSLGTPTSLQNNGYVQWLPNVGAQVLNQSDAVCSYALTGGEVSLLNQVPDAGVGTCTEPSVGVNVVGFDDDGLWSLEPAGALPEDETLDVTGWQAGHTRASSASFNITSQTATSLMNTFARQSSPVIYLGGPPGMPADLYVPHFDGTSVTLTRYPFKNELETHVDSKRLWRISGTTLSWWER